MARNRCARSRADRRRPPTPHGIAWAGRELLAGMELAVQDVNAEGGSGGGRLELVFEDT
jgi:hypothetical protein